MSDKISTRGLKHAVPCPHCGYKNDFRGMEEYTEAGMRMDCEGPEGEGCGKGSKIIKVEAVTLITLQKFCQCAVAAPNKKRTACKRCHMALP